MAGSSLGCRCVNLPTPHQESAGHILQGSGCGTGVAVDGGAAPVVST